MTSRLLVLVATSRLRLELEARTRSRSRSIVTSSTSCMLLVTVLVLDFRYFISYNNILVLVLVMYGSCYLLLTIRYNTVACDKTIQANWPHVYLSSRLRNFSIIMYCFIVVLLVA